MLTPTPAKVRESLLVVLKLLRPKKPFTYQLLLPVGDSGGPLIIHKRSRFIQVSFHFLICG